MDSDIKKQRSVRVVIVGFWVLGLLVAGYFLFESAQVRFQNAAMEAHGEGSTPVLQVLRNQIELFRVNHGGNPPAETALATMMLGRSDTTMTSIAFSRESTSGVFGPYLQAFPVNSLNSQSAVDTEPGRGIGWVYTVNGTSYTIQATDTTGTGVVSY